MEPVDGRGTELGKVIARCSRKGRGDDAWGQNVRHAEKTDRLTGNE